MDRQPLDDALVGAIMAKLLLVYGKRWENSLSGPMSENRAPWAMELAGLSAAGVWYALEHLPADYPPNVLQLRMIACQRPVDSGNALPAPEASPAIKQRALEAMQGLGDGMRARSMGA